MDIFLLSSVYINISSVTKSINLQCLAGRSWYSWHIGSSYAIMLVSGDALYNRCAI